MDIVISHKEWRGGGDKIKGLCTRLVKHLYDEGQSCSLFHNFRAQLNYVGGLGLVTHVMRSFAAAQHGSQISRCLPDFFLDLSSFRPHNVLRTGHWDSLEKALTIFRLPEADGKSRIHRRLDLIFASPEAYWTAVTGWSVPFYMTQ